MLRALAASNARPTTRAALRLALLLGLRDFSLRNARWQDIDLASAKWHVPAENMKGRLLRKKPYVTPLPRQAVAILEQLRPITDRGPDSLVFGRLSKSTLSNVLKGLGFKATAHGMRALLNGHLAECGFAREVREAQLAHVSGDATEQAYLRSAFWEHRTTMMAHWANTVDALEGGGPLPHAENVLAMRRAS